MDCINGFVVMAFFTMALFAVVFEDDNSDRLQEMKAKIEFDVEETDILLKSTNQDEDDPDLHVSDLATLQLLALQNCKERLPSHVTTCGDFWKHVIEGHCKPDHVTKRHTKKIYKNNVLKSGIDLHRQWNTWLDVCPFADVQCPEATYPYRSIDGSCNNGDVPLMGKADRAFRRYLPPDYADCIGSPRSGSGNLPSARLVSNVLFQKQLLPKSRIHTALHPAFGQLIDHDMDLTLGSTKMNSDTGGRVQAKCSETCNTDGDKNSACFPISVPENDIFMLEKDCLSVVRSAPYLNDYCKLGPRLQANQITSWLDASFVYGSTQHQSDNLRTFKSGLLRTATHPDVDKDFLDILPTAYDPKCKQNTEEHPCFTAGDSRVNVQVNLAALHTIFVRYHNYIARHLADKHPSWNDEHLYQETRKIVGAVTQQIVFKEYLPSVIGPEFTSKFDLLPLREGYYTGYTSNSSVANGDIANVFATAAFRFGHSQVGDHVLLSDPTLGHHEIIPLSQTFFNPALIYTSPILNGRIISGVNALTIGMATQLSDATDAHFSRQVAGSLFTDFPPNGVGMDLPAINTQRGRDHGLPGYIEWRKWANRLMESYGLEKYRMNIGDSFEELSDWINEDDIGKLTDLYDVPSDIDLYPGAMLERHLPGAAVGPTFAAIIVQQFRDLKRADRFYYENPGQFTEDQLNNIRSHTLSGIFCVTLEDDLENEDAMLSFQKYAMLRPWAQLNLTAVPPREEYALRALYFGNANTRRPCSSLPRLDFTLF